LQEFVDQKGFKVKKYDAERFDMVFEHLCKNFLFHKSGIRFP